jgi:hypothetical protein
MHILTWLACDRRGIDKGDATPQRITVSLSDPLGQKLDQWSLSGVSDIRTAGTNGAAQLREQRRHVTCHGWPASRSRTPERHATPLEHASPGFSVTVTVFSVAGSVRERQPVPASTKGGEPA